MKKYLYHLLIAIDQLANALLFGAADETLSARAWRTEQRGKILGRIMRPIIDVVAIILTLGRDDQHCFDSYMSEKLRRQLPPVYAEDKAW